MRAEKLEASCNTEQVIDLIVAVKELQMLSSQELGRLIRESDNKILHYVTRDGSNKQIDVEKLARFLSLHFVAVLISSERDDSTYKYLLSGFRLLHSLCDLASRHPKLEQILLDDVKVSEQLLDLIFYLLIVLGDCKGNYTSACMGILHSALVACSLHLLTGSISSQWKELAQVLLAHPKVDIFMDVAFAAVFVDIKFLHRQLSVQSTDSCIASGSSTLGTLNLLCQQSEASLQFLQSLCQQKLFREHLVKNKELCGKGGILLLAQAVMNLNIMPLFSESSLVASVSRMKSKVLSILLDLCEAESVSYLDEVASSPEGLDLAKSVALQVLVLLKEMFGRGSKQLWVGYGASYPRGILQLNAMRLMDIFSDDSNFRSYITIHFTEVLTEIFSLPHGEFLSCWCSSDLPVGEEDASLAFNPFAVAGRVLDLLALSDLSSAINVDFSFMPCKTSPLSSYAHQRTSLLVKVIANLHCFVPDICKDEKDLFLNKFLHCLQKEPPKSLDGFPLNSNAEKATTVSRNLRSLLCHAESLIPSFLNDEDVQLLRVFFSQLESLITSAESEVNRVQEDQSIEGCLSPLVTKVNPDFDNRGGSWKGCGSESHAFLEAEHFYARSNSKDQSEGIGEQEKMTDNDQPGCAASRTIREVDKDIQNVQTSGSDSSSTRGKNSADQLDNVEISKKAEQNKESGSSGVQEDEKAETVTFEEKQRRKRKRTIMNDSQITIIEKALLDEPEMQRNAASIRSWADKLSFHGSEVTTSQLKNWLNNRKARLARAAKDVRTLSEVENPDKQVLSGVAPAYDSSGSPTEDMYVPSSARGSCHSEFGENTSRPCPRESLCNVLGTVAVNYNGGIPELYVACEPGVLVMLVDGRGKEVGKGKVYQVNGNWYIWELKESMACVVDVFELKVERSTCLPYACDATGSSFDQAENMLGAMRVLWDKDKLVLLDHI